MASVHNAIKYGTSLLRAFSRAVGMDETEEGVARIGETLTPVLDIWSRPEFAFLRRERLVAAQIAQVAVAAEFSMVAILNPSGSRRIVVIERANFRSGAAGVAHLRTLTEASVTGTLALLTNMVMRDRRQASSPWLGSAQTWRGSDAVPPGQIIDQAERTASDGYPDFEVGLPVVLGPGQALAMEFTTVNVALTGCFAGYERQALPGEL